MKTIILLVLTTLFMSCSQQQEGDNRDIYASEIKGYWEGEENFIVVWDSIMLHPIKRTSGFHSYTVTNNLLTINNGSSTGAKAKLLKLNSDSLVFELKNDIFRYSRAKPVNPKSKFKNINFITGPCEGICPVFELKVIGNGQIEYNGKIYSEKSGKYYGYLRQSLVSDFNELLRYIDFYNLKVNQLPPPADNPKSELKIQFENNKILQIENGSGNSRYNALLNVMYNLGDIVELEN